MTHFQHIYFNLQKYHILLQPYISTHMAIISTKFNRYYYKKVVRQAVQLSYVYYTTSKALLTLRSLLDIFSPCPNLS